MAQLALATAGGAVGSIFGTTGAQIGFLAGSLIGSWLFAPSTTTEGPRLEDLRVTISTYGKPIPLGFGTIRTGGNVIFSTDIRETKNKRKVGGKGGPSATQITYTYDASFAVAFAQREATHVLRIWADSKLLYDVTAQAGGAPNGEVNREGVTFRVYLGTETQNVDPLIESEKGVGNTPAYRGIVYIVFEDLPLADFGNRIPSITAEIAFNGGDDYPTTDVTPSNADSTFPNQDCFTRDPVRPFVYLVTLGKLAKINLATGADLGGRQLPGANLGTQSTISDDGSLFVQSGSSNSAPVYKYNADSLSIVAGIGPLAGNPGWARHIGNQGFMLAFKAPQFSTTNPTVVGVIPRIGPHRMKFFNTDKITLLDNLTEGERALVKNPEGVPELVYHGTIIFSEIPDYDNDEGVMFVVDRDGIIWIITDKKALIQITIIGENSPPDYGIETVSSVFYGAERFDLSGDAIQSFDFIAYNEDDHSLLIATSGAVSSYDLTSIIKWDISTQAVVARYTTPGSNEGQSSIFSVGAFQGGVQNGKLFLGNGSKGALFDAVSLELLESFDWSNWATEDRRGYIYDEQSDSVYYAINNFGADQSVTRYWLRRATGAPETLDTVVDFLCNRAGLTDAMIDVTDLASDTVPGYSIQQQTSAKNAIAPLSSAFFFDGVESDWLLKFVKAGRSGDFAIPNADLAAHTGGSRPPELTEIINQEIELPRQVYVKYLDIDTAYEPGEAVAARRGDTVETKRRHDLNYPIALTASQAKEIATAWLYRLWTAQTTLRYSVSQKWLLVDPTDVGTVTKDSTAFTTQVTRSNLSDFVIDIQGLQEDAQVYSQDIDADSGRDQNTGDIARVGPSTPLFFDTTLIRDVDADVYGTGIRAYGAVLAYSNDWAGAAYFKSIDDEEFEDVLFFGSGEGVEYGHLTTDLAASSNWGTWDRFRFFRVQMTNGTPETATETNVLNGANAALVGNHVDGFELLQWATVTDEGDSVYKLEDLLRGRRGTNNFQTHKAGDLFVILSTDTVKRFLLDLDALNSTRYFVATSFGNVFNTNESISRAVVANALKPWSPADVRGEWDSPSPDDITVTWERRTRYGGVWFEGTGSVPLNEASEEYEADIIDSNGDVVRTFSALTSETFTYTSAQQTTDFGSNQTEIRCKLYQLSEIVGRGFVADETLTKG